MNRIIRSVALLLAADVVLASFATFGSPSPATAAVAPVWTCVVVPASTPTPTPTATDTVSPTPTGTPTPPPALTPLVQIAGEHNEIDETRTLIQVQLKSPGGDCLGGTVVLWEFIGGVWVEFRTLTVPDSGSLSLWISARTTTAWRAYAAPTVARHAAWSPVFTLYNTPPKRAITTPSWLPHPSLKPAQARAVGHGANPIIAPISDTLWARMVKASWHPGCPVGRAALRTLSVNYWGFDGFRHRGLLVIAAWAGRDFVGAFNGLYANSIPLRYVYPVDIFGWSSQTNGANDYASMRADNTSAFNCRWVDGSPGVMSPHSWGGAIDLNTFENPYDSATGWTPTAAWAGVEINPYAWRHTWDTVVSIMRANRFSWTYGTSDPQHFDAH
ncbi:hypothetical protein Back2_01870 [Nocardioides baekrokdamisoli]|uniref:Peptidase M15C domain-containing protein n=1 Tax=Nocardioides baekrokdamisoli TaxID=1804624 RepID=A0A3G9IAW9_9ACTN|nr:M15 family metallopeptidase [Nocardioides baekrokdamisoli]BBH15900.1 hypothetical protein Back2_01870 [Nocardioides baekrokdamisoli]